MVFGLFFSLIKIERRSKDWPKVRKAHLLTQPNCAVCGGRKKLEVHHIIPYHINRALELEPSNLITLCESKKYGLNCHLAVGHLGDYGDRYNPDVILHAQYLNKFFIKK